MQPVDGGSVEVCEAGGEGGGGLAEHVPTENANVQGQQQRQNFKEKKKTHVKKNTELYT